MSTAVRTPETVDLRRATRIFAAVILPVGPACVALLRFVIPYTTLDDSTDIAHAIAAEQSRQSAAIWLGFLATLTLVPAVLFVARVTRVRAPRLSAVALVLLMLGYLSIGFLVASDAAALYGAQHDLPAEDVAGLYEGSHPAVLVAGGLFVVGHVLGTVLLGIALLRTRVVPVPAAWLVIVAQPLHFVAAVILGSPTLDLVAWGANAAGFAAVSLAILRMTDQEWDPR